MSDTPRTDAACHATYAQGVAYIPLVGFMEQLERELNTAIRERDNALKIWRMSSVCRNLAYQRDRLVSALQSVMDYRQGTPPYDFHQYREAERDNMAHDAWQVVEQNCLSLLSETSDRSDANAIND
jgi:recombinational DNA repair ATPase RecF